MQERLEVATRASCGTGSVASACLAGVATLLLGGVCLVDAFVVPGLFGPLAAAVIAAERLLCAARSSSTRAAAAWTAIAFGWIAVASCMVHAPWVSIGLLQWLVVSIVASSAICRLWMRFAASALPLSIWLVVAGAAAQLATLFGGTGGALARVAAAVAIELVLIGMIRLFGEYESRRDALLATSPIGPRYDTRGSPDAGMIKLDTRIA